MVLPETWSTALFLIILSSLCFGLWPSLYKLSNWRFELFSFDFAAGALLVAVITAYTLGTLGSALDFGDAMLVAGRRAEAMAFLAGGVFAFGNMLYLGTVSLAGLANATLLVFSVFGSAVSIEYLHKPQILSSSIALVVFIAAAAMAIWAAVARSSANLQKSPVVSAANKQNLRYSRSSKVPPKPISATSKALFTGILGGIVLATVAPAIAMAEEDKLSIGAYGGMLMVTLGLAVATLFQSFFFLNISLQDGVIGYSSYFAGTARNHIVGLFTGALWSAGALALYIAYSGTAGVTRFDVWLVVFIAALIALLSGLTVWRSDLQTIQSDRIKILAAILFAVASIILIAGFRR